MNTFAYLFVLEFYAFSYLILHLFYFVRFYILSNFVIEF